MLNKTKLLLLIITSLLIQACSTSSSYYSVDGQDTELSYINTQSDPVVAANATIGAAVNR